MDYSTTTDEQDTSSLERRVLHITEAYAGGVATAITDYVRNSPQYKHFLAYSDRGEEVDPPSIFSATFKLPTGHVTRIQSLKKLLSNIDVEVIHAHSSFAGVYARIASPYPRRHVVYTPHGYSFIRRDISHWQRFLYFGIECILAPRTAIYACCSPYECELTNKFPFTDARTILVPNVANGMNTGSTFTGEHPHICMIGRLTAAKDPTFFRDCWLEVQKVFPDATATWYGDGDSCYRDILLASGVRVTGWWSIEHIQQDMAALPTIYLHSSAWEGYPISLLEVACWGIPIIVRNIPAFMGSNIPVLINSPDEICDSISLFSRPGYANEVADTILNGHSDGQQQAALTRAYGLVGRQ